MNARLFLLPLLGALLCSTPALAGPNLLTNGSFEDAIHSNTYWTVNPGGTTLPGWSTGGDGVQPGQYCFNHWEAAHGVVSVDLNDSTYGSMSQTVTTSPGTTYELSFAMAVNPACGERSSSMEVTTGGAVGSYSYTLPSTVTGTKYRAEDYDWHTQTFTASGTTTVITFQSTSPSCGGPVVDALWLDVQGGGGGWPDIHAECVADPAGIDGDGIYDATDVIDGDSDGTADDCDVCPDDAGNDSDEDGICYADDNCADVANPNQSDVDGDGVGDSCEADSDSDGVIDDADNCPLDHNTDQADTDGDLVGDACDTDVDGDGVIDGDDSCLGTAAGAPVLDNGCSVDQECACDASWKNHGAYVSCVAQTLNQLSRDGLIAESERDTQQVAASQSQCGKK